MPSLPPIEAPSSFTTEALRTGDDIVIAPEVRRLCRIGEIGEGPKFDFDSARLAASAHGPLEELARCLTTGPLQGKQVMLVGHTDARGTAAYNFSLGTYRAVAVETYLEKLGVAKNVLATASRGELDATGYDEASWALDRRVDIHVAGI